MPEMLPKHYAPAPAEYSIAHSRQQLIVGVGPCTENISHLRSTSHDRSHTQAVEWVCGDDLQRLL
jgi:hypothetical protein